jgi:integrase/recombinase XerD
VVAAPPALIRAGIETLPATIAAAGAHTSERFIEFFTANIRNRNTRMAYALAVRQFFDWCEQRGFQLDAIRPTTVAAYIEQLGTVMAKPSVKQHLAAVRQLFDYLVTGGILPSNPAGAVRGPKYVVKRGKTPVLSADQARQLLDSIDVTELSGLRDRALIGVMVYSFARVSAAATLRVEDYFENGKRAWLRLHEEGGKRHEVPCHHNLASYLDAWINVAVLPPKRKAALPGESEGKQADRESDGAGGRFSDDQTASEGSYPALLHLLSHISCDRYHDVHAKRWNARARAADRGARITSHHQAV